MLTAAELDALRLSLQVALVAVTFSLPFAILAAWLLARREFPGKALLDAVIHLPLVLPPVVIGFFLLVLLGTKGPIGAWLAETSARQADGHAPAHSPGLQPRRLHCKLVLCIPPQGCPMSLQY